MELHRLAGLEAVGEDTERGNNAAVMTAPVKGRPRVLYVEGEYERNPQVASYFKRAMDRENIDVEVRGARGMPSSFSPCMEPERSSTSETLTGRRPSRGGAVGATMDASR